MKPIPEKKYLQYIKLVGWSLKEGSIDHKLMDENGKFIATVKITHDKGKKREVPASHVRKTKNHL